MPPSALSHVDEILTPKRARQLAVFLDYDGTLTPIVRRPQEAVLSTSMRQTIRALAQKLPVAILSGRDLGDTRQRVDIGQIVYAGSHGFDIAGPQGLRKEMATEFLPVLAAAEKKLQPKLRKTPGALLERKRFSIAAHYREVRPESVPKVEEAVVEVAMRHRELRTISGKKVYELQPDVDWNKGKALLWLLGVVRSKSQREVFPIYLGDDVTDEDAFRAVRGRGIGIVVSEQTRSTAARFRLKTPVEVEQFLREILSRVR